MKETFVILGLGALIIGSAAYAAWAVFAVAIYFMVGMNAQAIGVAISAIVVAGTAWQVARWADEAGI